MLHRRRDLRARRPRFFDSDAGCDLTEDTAYMGVEDEKDGGEMTEWRVRHSAEEAGVGGIEVKWNRRD